MSIAYASRPPQRRPSNLPPWLQRLLGSAGPEPDPQAAALAALQRQVDALGRQLTETREDLARETGYAQMLNNITARQDGEIQSLASQLADTQAQLKQTIEDKQHQARIIADLRVQLTGQSAEIAELRERIRVMTEDLAATRNRALVEEAKARFLDAENASLRLQVKTLTAERDALLQEVERWQRQ